MGDSKEANAKYDTTFVRLLAALPHTVESEMLHVDCGVSKQIFKMFSAQHKIRSIQIPTILIY